ncbi:helix-turn-helix domain-containing protein [Massilia sp. G4R7]|uniref:Helix-turn-helix domain-containing protein n=1 Tax=Massilia phyllostachyos TaxID=2898585 RepID=A0ABS8Q886_9BURK|nr:helix-turn-helix domain-containing protein [Massilia phyllostachyos]MCD2517979.1 helix-turn-helix domain-containing protein [Massilia phyllostachyos]
MKRPTKPEDWNEKSVRSMDELGKLVREVRKGQGMTQEDVSGLAGLGNRFIIDLERGKETIQMQKAIDVLGLLGLELIVRKT